MRERKKKAKNSDNRLLEKNDRPSIAIELPIPRERKKKNITFIRDERLLHSPARGVVMRRSVPLKNHVPREKWRDERCERRSEKERERKKWGGEKVEKV